MHYTAINSPPLVFMALLHLKRQLQLADFFRLVSRHPPACRLLEVYARSRNPDLLRDFFYQDDRRYDAAMFEYEQAWRFEGSKERMAKMETAIGLVKNIKEHAAVAKV